ncbi:pentatricopeptide repeat-containing protein At5g43790-like [Typha latifolia]|uniref:pentatricopeptide repeat-containing protein At5g43790-like n=1 Tax=Typha latifolia TaxID=4733 RepID=UPI003C30D0A8
MKPPSPAFQQTPLFRLLETTPKTPSTFKQLHAHFITSGLANHTYPLSRLLLFSSSPPIASLLGFSYSTTLLRLAPHPSTFLFNTLTSSLASHGETRLALHLYSSLLEPFSPKPNSHTYPSLLKACASPPWIAYGLALHAQLVKFVADDAVDRFVHAALVGLYSRCGKIETCRKIFDQVSNPDTPTWNSILSAYARRAGEVGCYDSGVETLVLFERCQLSSIKPNEISVVAVISTCGDLEALGQGMWAHAFVRRSGLAINLFVATALIEMYSKCGRLDLAEQVFDGLPQRDTLCYNAMIRGLAIHGHGRRALGLLDRMRIEGARVDGVTMVVVMSACAHAGLVMEGRHFFDKMEEDFGITPKVEHYGCLVDLLGRAGQIEEAEEVICRMSMKPNAVMYRSLIGACRVHNKVYIGERLIKELIQLEPWHGGNYVLLSNIYSNINRWDDARKARKAMKERGIDKTPGSSLVEMDGIMHEFLTGDKSHPVSDEIYAMLQEIDKRLHECGHKPSTKNVLFDVEEEDKEDALTYHSGRTRKMH